MHAVAAFFASIITFAGGFFAPTVALDSPVDVRTTQPAAIAAAQTEITGNPFNDPTATPAAAVAPAPASSPPPVQTIINQPVIERIIERIVPQGGMISADTLSAILADFEQSIGSRIAAINPPKAAIPEQVAAAGNATVSYFPPASQRIDQLTHTVINNPTISGGTISGASITGTISNVINSALGTIDDLTSNAVTAANALFTNATTTNLAVTNLTASATSTLSGMKLAATDCSAFGNGGKLTTDAFGNVTCAADQGGGGGAVGGLNTQVQFNDAGSFGGNAAFTFDKTAARLTVTNASTTNITASYASSTVGHFGTLSADSFSLAAPLSASSGGTGINNPSAAGILLGSFAGGAWQQLATSSLGLPTFADLSSQLSGYAPTTRTIATTYPLQGGGDLSANRTLSLAFGTSSSNTWGATQTFTNPITGSITGDAGTLGGLTAAQLIAAGFSTTSANHWQTTRDFFSTTSVTYWKSVTDLFSTTSASYFLAQNQGASFSTTSADAWKVQRSFFATSSTDYWLTQKTTTDLAEGSNLYFTTNRVAAVLAATTTDALTQGSANRYYSSLLFAADLVATTTDALDEGVTNLYWTPARFDTRLASYDKGYFFSTTSANYWKTQSTFTAASTTLLGDNNIWSGGNIFGNASTTNYYIASTITGAGLSSCNGSGDKLAYNAATKQFECGSDAGAGGGITGLRAQYSLNQTGSTQTFATSSDSNLLLTITSSGDTHTFAPSWTGTLAASRGGTGTSTPATWGNVLYWNGANWQGLATSSLGITSVWGSITGTISNQTDLQSALDAKLSLSSWYATTTSALAEGSNLYFTNGRVAAVLAGTTSDALAEGSNNLYWTNTRFDARLAATTSLPTLTTLANLASIGTITSGVWNGSTIGTPYGGTGSTTLSGILKGNGASAVQTALPGTDYELPLSFNAPLSRLGNAISLSTAGDWSGTLGGFSASQLIAAGFSTTSADAWKSNRSFFATSSSDYWLTTKTTDNLAQGSTNKYYATSLFAADLAGTTTNALAEGGSNLYFTDARADQRINATSTIGTLTSAPNLGTVAASLTGFLKATAGVLSTAAINLAADITGTLGVANGGTGWNAIAAGAIPYGNGSSALATTSAGTAGQVLALLNGVPTWTATTTFSAPLSYANGAVSLAQANGSTNGYLGSTDWTLFNGKISSSSLSAVYPLAYNSSTGVFTTAFSTTTNNTFSGTNVFNGQTTFANASTTNLTASGTVYASAASTTNLLIGQGATTSALYIASTVYGAGLTNCSGSGDKLLWNSTTRQFTCGGDAGAGGGITGLKGQYSSAQNGATQTFATSSDTNLQLTITSSGDTHTFAPSWTGTLGISRGGTGTSTPATWGNVLYWNGANWQGLATSSLGIASVWGSITGTLSNQTDLQNALDAKLSLSSWYATTTSALAEGSNLYFTDGRVQSYLDTLTKGYFFSTTSADYWKGVTSFFSTSSTDYWKTQNSFFSTTSVAYWESTQARWATTSTDYWESTQTRWATTSAAYFLSQNQGLAFSTTSADYWKTQTTFTGASTTLLADRNTWSGLNVFGNTTTTLASFGNAWITGITSSRLLALDENGKIAATTTIGANLLAGVLSVSKGGTGTSTNAAYGNVLAWNGSNYQGFATSTLGLSTTDILEGNNLYFTNARADARINATSTIGTLTSAPNLGTVATSLTGFLKATAGVLSTAAINVAADITGILPVGNGGTGWSNIAAGAIPYGNGSSALATTSAGTAGQVLALLNGVPTWTATTTFSAPLSYANGAVSLAQANGSTNGYLGSTDWTLFNGKISSSSLSAVYPLAYNSSTGVFTTAFSTTTNNTFSGTNVFNGQTTFANASTTNLSVSGSTWLSNLTASTLLALDANKQVVSTTTIGANMLTGVLATINAQQITAGGTFTITAASSTLLANNNTWSGVNSFSNASSSLLSVSGQSWFTGLASFGNASSSVFSAATICLTGDTCRTTWPTGGAGAWPWTAASNFGTSTNSTTTATWFKTGLYASSTSQFVNANFWGNVGIATSSPLQNLDVYGDLVLSGTSRYLNFGATSSTAVDTNGYGFRDNAGVMEFKNAGGTWQGVTTATSGPSFSVNRNGSDQTGLTDPGYNKINWTTEAFDTNNNFNLSTDRFTPTVPGKYIIGMNTYCSSATACQAVVYKNGSEYAEGSYVISSTGSNLSSLSVIIDMNGSTDYLEGYAYISGNTVLYGGVEGTFFTGALLAPVNGNNVANWQFDGTQTTLLDSTKLVGIGTSTPWGKLSVQAANNASIPQFVVGSSTATSLIVNNQGFVGIGTSTPQAKLSVQGTAGQTNDIFQVASSSGASFFSVFVDPAATFAVLNSDTNTDANITLKNAGADKWHIYHSAVNSNISVGDADYSNGVYMGQNASSWTGFSDARLKDSVETYPVLDRIRGYRAVSFDWKASGVHDIGVIAQELYQVFPEAVDRGSDDASLESLSIAQSGIWGVHYDKLGALALQGLKELSAKLDTLSDMVSGFAERFTTKELVAVNGRFDKLCVGSTCVTEDQFIAMVAAASQTAGSPSASAPAGTPQAPVIELNGNASSTIEVGDTYNDLGARITAPESDLNLGIVALLDGATTTAISIDTSVPGEHTILYTVTSPTTGLTGTIMRTVIVQSAADFGMTSPPQDEILPATDDVQPINDKPAPAEDTDPFNAPEEPANDNASSTSLLIAS